MLRNCPVILWHYQEGRPPADDSHHTAAGVHAAADFLSCHPREVWRAIHDGNEVGGGWFADLADPRQVEGASA